jgi:hypothetical protein
MKREAATALCRGTFYVPFRDFVRAVVEGEATYGGDEMATRTAVSLSLVTWKAAHPLPARCFVRAPTLAGLVINRRRRISSVCWVPLGYALLCISERHSKWSNLHIVIDAFSRARRLRKMVQDIKLSSYAAPPPSDSVMHGDLEHLLLHGPTSLKLPPQSASPMLEQHGTFPAIHEHESPADDGLEMIDGVMAAKGAVDPWLCAEVIDFAIAFPVRAPPRPEPESDDGKSQVLVPPPAGSLSSPEPAVSVLPPVLAVEVSRSRSAPASPAAVYRRRRPDALDRKSPKKARHTRDAPRIVAGLPIDNRDSTSTDRAPSVIVPVPSTTPHQSTTVDDAQPVSEGKEDDVGSTGETLGEKGEVGGTGLDNDDVETGRPRRKKRVIHDMTLSALLGMMPDGFEKQAIIRAAACFQAFGAAAGINQLHKSVSQAARHESGNDTIAACLADWRIALDAQIAIDTERQMTQLAEEQSKRLLAELHAADLRAQCGARTPHCLPLSAHELAVDCS